MAPALVLGSCNPKHSLALRGALSLLVAFLSAGEDIVIDAWRVEILEMDLQGPGAAMIETGYRIAMLVSSRTECAPGFPGHSTRSSFAIVTSPSGPMARPATVNAGLNARNHPVQIAQ